METDSTTLAIDWDSDSNVTAIRDRVALIQKGCGCKTGCQTNRCKCKKSNRACGPGCKYQSCTNLPQTSPPSQVANLDQEGSSESELDFTDYEVDIMEEVWGDCGETVYRRQRRHGLGLTIVLDCNHCFMNIYMATFIDS